MSLLSELFVFFYVITPCLSTATNNLRRYSGHKQQSQKRSDWRLQVIQKGLVSCYQNSKEWRHILGLNEIPSHINEKGWSTDEQKCFLHPMYTDILLSNMSGLGWLMFNGISTFVGYLISNLYIYNFKQARAYLFAHTVKWIQVFLYNAILFSNNHLFLHS